jgi:phosphoserine aminotransferase
MYTMAHRVFNFNAGPSTLPLDVLKIVQNELLDFKGTGMSIMEMSHRSKEFDALNDQTIALTRELCGLDDKYQVLFLGGGASTQFAMVPINLLSPGQTAAYVDTGNWSSKAMKEAKMIGAVHLAGSSKDVSYRRIPKPSELNVPANAAYLHITSNNTIEGTQYFEFPSVPGVPLVCDMSSDILSHQMDFKKFSLIYAGAQKNLGPAGVTMVIIHDDLLAKCKDGQHTMFDYRTHAKEKSLYNTPPAFAVYVVKLVLEWIKSQGGLQAVEKINRTKQDLIYKMMDKHADYYKGTVDKDSRSWMNITFRLPSEELEAKFISEAKAAGFIGLKGHRSVGGIRASCYNAMTIEGCEKLAGFMEQFKSKN